MPKQTKLRFGGLSKKICNSVPKEFMTTIHVLCSNFTEIGHREVDETIRCFGDKNSQNAFFSPCFAPVWPMAPKVGTLQGSVPPEPTSPVV